MTLQDGAARTGQQHLAGLPSRAFWGRLDRLMSEWRRNFAEAYTEYGPGAADETGLAGQWADMFRKIMKLKRSLWSGESGYLKRETEREILLDLISHAFLALEMIERGQTGGRTSSAATGDPSLGASRSSTGSA
jgi:hypothetical protein